MKKILLSCALMLASTMLFAEVIRLDLSQPTNPEAFEFNEAGMWAGTWSEAAEYTYFTTQAFQFSHLLSGNSWGGTTWDGFTVSKATADGEGYGYYSNTAKGGLNGFATPYILAYYNEWWLMDDANEDMMSSNHILFDGEYYPRYVYLNNAFVSYQNILEGGGAARAFHQGDKFEVWIKGLDEDYEEGDEKVVYRLADYTSENEAEWFVNTKWAKVDLSALGKVSGLSFTVVSTDQGVYGTNTATYFALDGLTISTTADEDAPEPVVAPVVATFENIPAGINVAKADTCWQGADAPALGWNNWTSGDYNFQSYYGGNSGYGEYYSAFTVSNETANTSTGPDEPNRSAKGGAYEGQNFASWNLNYYGADTITFDAQIVPGFFLINNAYAVTSMCNGDGYAKKFGKDDWFKLTCIGVRNGAKTNELDVYLAQDGKYIAEWTYVDLSELGEIDGLTFNMSSSDESYGYMNTPAYFCMDNFGAEKPENYVEPARAEFDLTPSAVSNTNAAVMVQKIIRDGQVLIIRDGKTINMLGVEL